MERRCGGATEDGGLVRRSREPRGEPERRRASESESGVDETTNGRLTAGRLTALAVGFRLFLLHFRCRAPTPLAGWGRFQSTVIVGPYPGKPNGPKPLPNTAHASC